MHCGQLNSQRKSHPMRAERHVSVDNLARAERFRSKARARLQRDVTCTVCWPVLPAGQRCTGQAARCHQQQQRRRQRDGTVAPRRRATGVRVQPAKSQQVANSIDESTFNQIASKF
eukprot:COSAG02_NODE_13686_length_1362_cov_1.309580_1_plen_116_part_00